MRACACVLALLLALKLTAQAPKPAGSEIDVVYDEDQKDRSSGMPTSVPAIKRLMERDAVHSAKVRELIAGNALKTGRDYEKAAIIFQHGQEPDDILLAHVLAMVAIARGNDDAIWIAAATLDRYLQKIGRPQVLGTQSGWKEVPIFTQEPYNRSLIPDSLREALHVPDLEQQAKDLAKLNKNQQAVPK